MKLLSLGERELIAQIRKDFSELPPGVVLGIGDDSAVIRSGKKYLLFTKDLLFEDVHFIRTLHPPYLLGRKSLDISFSDIAAMGGVPKYALLGLGLPPQTDLKWIEDFFSGFKSAADEEGVALIGGDVSVSRKISISVTVVGESRWIVRRRGAREGHYICVSGTLGDAKQGFILLKKGYRLGDEEKADVLLNAFLDPSPQVGLGQKLSRLNLVSSMIDVSDGLSVDLFHLCRESRTGAEVYLEKLPLSPEIRFFQRQPYRLALHGGEDYQLLFTVPPEKMSSLLMLGKTYRITSIGRMIKGTGIFLVDRKGQRKPLEAKGYQHFAGRIMEKA